jgi:hypothetical protein
MVLRRREAASAHLLLLYVRNWRGGVHVRSPLQRTFRRGGCKERGEGRAHALRDNVVIFNIVGTRWSLALLGKSIHFDLRPRCYRSQLVGVVVNKLQYGRAVLPR